METEYADQGQTKRLIHRFKETRNRFTERDENMARIFAARHNRLREIAPDLFPEDGPITWPIIANTIDIAARDMAEQISPLPTITCTSGEMITEKEQERASLRTKIAASYIAGSRLGSQMASGADWMVTYGWLPAKVELCHEEKRPEIRLVDPRGIYPIHDRMGRLTAVFQALIMPMDQLCELYPEYAPTIKGDQAGQPGNEAHSGHVEIVFYHDKDIDAAFIPARGLTLDLRPNRYKKVMWRIAQRPGLTTMPRGQFDDAVWVHVIRNSWELMTYEAMDTSVHAPIAVPNDVGNVPVGPGAILRSANPEKIGRVNINVPNQAFAMGQQLETEVRNASRYPETRTGNSSQSIVTGRGVQQLEAGFDSQIASYQQAIADMLTDLIGLCFEVDEKTWGNVTKTIVGQSAGSPYVAKYKPARDINGDYAVDVTYGLAAGLDPNRLLIYVLQMLGGNLISLDTARRYLPGNLDVIDEERKTDTERLDKAAMTAIEAFAAAIPQMAAQGQDVTKAVRAIALVKKGRAQGKDMADLIADVFGVNLDPNAQDPAAQAPASDPAAATGGAQLPGQGQQRPDLMNLLASVGQGGKPNMTAQVQRSIPISA